MTERAVPIFATAVASFRFVLTHRRDLVRVGLLAVPAFLIVDLALDVFDTLRLSGWGLNIAAIKAVADLVLRAVIAAVLLVAWHRVVMLKTSERGDAPPLACGLREMRYLGVWLLLSVGFLAVFAITAALAVAVQFVAMLGAYLVLLLLGLKKSLIVGQQDQLMIVLWVSVFFAVPVASYVTGRLSLVLPALAVDRQRPLRQAWRMSAGNGWRLVAASLIVLVPLEALASLCSAAASSARATAAYYPLALAAATSLFLLIVLTGTILSLFSIRLDGAARDDAAYETGIAVAE